MLNDANEEFTMRAIGVIRSPFKQAEGTPIQSAFADDVEGTVEVFEPYVEGLRDLALFSHIYLLYRFHRAKPERLTVTPFMDDQPRGVFATRAPVRPNGIGLSIVRLLECTGGRLRVSGVDVLDETPLLDIKPYAPIFDCRPDANSGWIKPPTRAGDRTKADARFERP